MKRYATRLLLAYALSMTLLAAWLGCGQIVYWRLACLATGPGPSPTYEQLLANISAPVHLTSPIERLAMVVAGAEPANIAAACFVIVLACLMLGRRKGPSSNRTNDSGQ